MHFVFARITQTNPDWEGEDARSNHLHSGRAQFVCRQHRRHCARYEWDERQVDGVKDDDPQAHDQKKDDDAKAADDEEAADAAQYVTSCTRIAVTDG
jgi:hypothetical protein